nr:hypothetical protein [Fodinicola feengrottensis]
MLRKPALPYDGPDAVGGHDQVGFDLTPVGDQRLRGDAGDGGIQPQVGGRGPEQVDQLASGQHGETVAEVFVRTDHPVAVRRPQAAGRPGRRPGLYIHADRLDSQRAQRVRRQRDRGASRVQRGRLLVDRYPPAAPDQRGRGSEAADTGAGDHRCTNLVHLILLYICRVTIAALHW